MIDRRTMRFATWGVLGVALAVLECVIRLGDRALGAMASGLEPSEWACLAISVVAFSYGEGYLALHKRFVPRMLARAFASSTNRNVWAAPLYAMGLLGGTRLELARAWGGVALVVLAIVLVRACPSPARELIDAGVACALLFGLVSIAASFTARLFVEQRVRSRDS